MFVSLEKYNAMSAMEKSDYCNNLICDNLVLLADECRGEYAVVHFAECFKEGIKGVGKRLLNRVINENPAAMNELWDALFSGAVSLTINRVKYVIIVNEGNIFALPLRIYRKLPDDAWDYWQ